MKMKRIPLVTLPLAIFVVVVFLFIVVVPAGGDLISAKGDFILGQVLFIIFILFLLIDIVNLIKSKKK
jgi:hypothetical protein